MDGCLLCGAPLDPLGGGGLAPAKELAELLALLGVVHAGGVGGCDTAEGAAFMRLVRLVCGAWCAVRLMLKGVNDTLCNFQ